MARNLLAPAQSSPATSTGPRDLFAATRAAEQLITPPQEDPEGAGIGSVGGDPVGQQVPRKRDYSYAEDSGVNRNPLQVPGAAAAGLGVTPTQRAEMRNVEVGTIESLIDWMSGVSKATQANPGIAGKFAQTVYNKSLQENMPDEQAQALGFDSTRDYIEHEQGAFKEQLLKDVSTAQEIVGSVAGGVIDPVSMATGSWGMASPVGWSRVLKLATAGSSYGGTYETLDQLVKDGEITSPASIAAYAAVGGLLPVGFDKTVRVLGGLKNEAALKTLEKYTKSGIDEGLNPTAAFNKALQRSGMDKGTVSDILDGNGMQRASNESVSRWINGVEEFVPRKTGPEDYVDFTKVNNGILKNLKNRAVGVISNVQQGIDSAIEPLSSSIRKISVPVLSGVRRFEYFTNKDTNRWRSVADPFATVYKSLGKQDKVRFDKAVYNRDTEMASQILRKSGGDDAVKTYLSVRPLLDDIFEEMKAVGVDVNYLSNHWPRYLKQGEHDRFLKKMGWNEKSTYGNMVAAKEQAKGLRTDLASRIAKAEEVKGSPLTPDEIAWHRNDLKDAGFRREPLSDKEKSDMLNSYFKGIAPEGLSTPNAAKSRVIENISDDMLEFYPSAVDNLMSYIDHAAHTINMRKFFGKHIASDTDVNADGTKAIGSFVGALRDAGEITNKDVDRLAELLQARFGYAPTGKLVQATKNIFYGAQLGQWDSALTQLGDLGTAAYVNGLGKTVVGYFAPQMKNHMEEMGLQKIAAEFGDSKATAKALDGIFRASGFKRIDGLGKKAHIEGSLRKNQDLLKTGKGLNKFRGKWEEFFGDETDDLINDLMNRRITDNVKLMLFNELSDVQPISLSEVPKVYLESPRGRVFYAMKTFTIKQIDLLRRDAISKIVSGSMKEKAIGVANLTKYAMSVTPANLTAEQMKNFVTGKEVDFTDVQISTFIKNFGISQYLLDQLGKGQGIKAINNFILSNPVLGVAEMGGRVWDDLANFGKQFKSLQDVPVIGSVADNLIGEGMKKRAKENEAALLGPSYGIEDTIESQY